LSTATERHRCPKCTWEFAFRRKRLCPTCGTLLLVPSDKIPDTELGALGSFWIWNTANQKWCFIRNWEEHKREAMEKFDEYMRSK
jgi:hypothetical protein